ncbi:pentapeptide repeat-containing protein [Methylotuvimicrobium sp. KM1]|uniref:pentapeptide repeat-containing protein n=1 Tax=Methylotuvimicrobium sp. KM1 TaxID=3377707 RepID=UPI00384EE341
MAQGDSLQACNFRTTDGKACARSVNEDSQYCSLHFGYDRKITDEILDNPRFATDFQAVLETHDGDWRGFIFPHGIKLPKKITFKVNARECRLASFDLKDVVFKESVDFSDAIFKGAFALRSTIFEDIVKFDRCRFESSVDVLYVQCKKSASFYRADFLGRTILRANFLASVNFNEVVFHDATIFSGWRTVSLRASSLISVNTVGFISVGSKPSVGQMIRHLLVQTRNSISRFAQCFKNMTVNAAKNIHRRLMAFHRRFAKADPDTQIYRVFEGVGELKGVVFMKPDQTLFSEVNLSKVYFSGTNLRGVRFLGVKWWQPNFKRNGLYDEVSIQLSTDGPYRHLSLPILEETCRNARVALEENRNFNAASDFYVAEMEAAQAQLPGFMRHFFSVNALYKSVSNYGTSVATAIRMLVWLYLLHFSASFYLELQSGTLPQMQQFSEQAIRSIKVLLLTPDPKFANVSTTQSWFDIVLRLLGPIQLAMVALAFRSRIKRH